MPGATVTFAVLSAAAPFGGPLRTPSMSPSVTPNTAILREQ
jgi:hypothetical protein